MMVSNIRKHIGFLCILWLVSIVVRIAVFYGYLSEKERYWQVDSQTYHVVAANIAEGKGITLSDGSPNFYRLPGYPFFISLCYSIFGVNKIAALWVQVLIASFIPILVFFLALALFPTRFLLAKVVSIISALHLGLVLYSGFFMSESLFIFLLLVCLILFFTVQRRALDVDLKKNDNSSFPSLAFYPIDDFHGEAFLRVYDQVVQDSIHEIAGLKGTLNMQRCITYQLIMLAGFVLGLASLVRPVGHYAIMLFAGLFFITIKASYVEKLRKTVMLLLGWLLPVSFWLVRNYLLLGHIFFHTLPGGHFLHLSAARVAMHVHEVSYQEARTMLQDMVNERIVTKGYRIGRQLNEIERCHAHEEVAIEYFKKRPLITLKNWFTDIMRASLSLYSAEVLYLESGRKEYDYFKKGRSTWDLFKRYLMPETDSWQLKLLVYTEILFFLVILIGFGGYALRWLLSLSVQGFTTSAVFFMQSSLFIAFFLVIALAGGYARMRLPIEPLLWVYAISFYYSLLFYDQEKNIN